MAWLLIYSSFIIAELHRFFGDRIVTVGGVSMPLNWAVKYTCDQAVYVMLAAALLTFTRTRANITAAKVFFSWTIIDAISYFYNYKQREYWHVYAILLILIIFFSSHEKRNNGRAVT